MRGTDAHCFLNIVSLLLVLPFVHHDLPGLHHQLGSVQSQSQTCPVTPRGQLSRTLWQSLL